MFVALLSKAYLDIVVSDDGINIATTGGYAYAVLKLT
jgi:hypothetical protein